MKGRLKEIFSEIAEQYEFEIEEMSIQTDHVYLFVSAPPRYSPARLADILEEYILPKDDGRVSQAGTTPLAGGLLTFLISFLPILLCIIVTFKEKSNTHALAKILANSH